MTTVVLDFAPGVIVFFFLSVGGGRAPVRPAPPPPPSAAAAAAAAAAKQKKKGAPPPRPPPPKIKYNAVEVFFFSPTLRWNLSSFTTPHSVWSTYSFYLALPVSSWFCPILLRGGFYLFSFNLTWFNQLLLIGVVPSSAKETVNC